MSVGNETASSAYKRNRLHVHQGTAVALPLTHVVNESTCSNSLISGGRYR